MALTLPALETDLPDELRTEFRALSLASDTKLWEVAQLYRTSLVSRVIVSVFCGWMNWNDDCVTWNSVLRRNTQRALYGSNDGAGSEPLRPVQRTRWSTSADYSISRTV